MLSPSIPPGTRLPRVLFPRYVKGAPAELTRLDPAQSLALLGEGGSLLPTTDGGLAEFLAWWGRLPAYRLSYGRLDEAAAAVRALTEGLGAARNGGASGPPRRAPSNPERSRGVARVRGGAPVLSLAYWHAYRTAASAAGG